MNFRCGQKTFCQLLPTFCAAGRPSVHFCQHSVPLGDLPYISINFLFGREPSINFRQILVPPGDLPSTFHACGRHSGSFHLLPVWPGELLSTPMNFLFVRYPSVISANFPCCQDIFRRLLSTFFVWGRTFDIFLQLTVPSGDLLATSVNLPSLRENFSLLPSTFRAARRPYVNFRQLSVQPGHLPSTSINFPCLQETFCQYFVWLGVLPSTSINFLCSQKTYCNFRQFFVQPGDLPSTSVKFPRSWETFRQLP